MDFLTEGIGSVRANNLAVTRSTFPSTGTVGTSNAIEATAEAV